LATPTTTTAISKYLATSDLLGLQQILGTMLA